MNLITVIFIALGLSMDTFAVSVTSGVTARQFKLAHALRIGFVFGISQALMLLCGWIGGIGFKNFISAVDHWVAFVILTLIGSKMIYESVRIETLEKEANLNSPFSLLVLSIATSIDALAVGFTFSMLNVSMATPVIVIGLVTFLVSIIGVYIGDKVGHFFEKKVEIAGGIILIAIGIKILLEHLH